jgi:hypothetical protein
MVERGDANKQTTRGMQPWAAVTGQRDNVGGLPVRDAKTIGWQLSCKCNASEPIVSARVLDPFAGSGTTGLVADRLGRDCTLIDLSPEYVAMARARIKDDAPLFAEVAE